MYPMCQVSHNFVVESDTEIFLESKTDIMVAGD